MKYYILIGCFLLTAVLASGTQYRTKSVIRPPLRDYFPSIKDYTLLKSIELSKDHLKMLELDDYFFADYMGKDGQVNLYIGYYYTSNKAYSAHSPMICYPSQGWQVENRPIRHTLNVGSNAIEYEEIVTAHGDMKELVLYWYQARTKTNTQVYKNKIDMGYNKLMYNDEQHAFVRIVVPFSGSPYDQVKEKATTFITSFYPLLCAFVREDGRDSLSLLPGLNGRNVDC